MGFRFTKRIKIIPGVSINLGKKNVSVSVGPRGAKFTAGTAGTRTTLGIPGTGIYYSQKLNKKTQSSKNDMEHVQFGDPKLDYAVNYLKELPEKHKISVIQKYEKNKKQTWIAYFVWIFGLQYLYLMKPLSLFFYWITGWGFGIWALIDLIRIPGLIKEYNRKKLIKVVEESEFL